MKYRKKPVVIEAIQFTKEMEDSKFKELINFIGGENIAGASGSPMDKIIIKTLEGDMTASDGDYIIKGVNGEFYPCKPDIFDKTYNVEDEPVLDQESKRSSFVKAATPLVKLLCENYHPHVTVIVTPTGAELVEGIEYFKTDKYIVD